VRAVFAILALVLATLAKPAAAAINCRVSVTPFSFGNYLPGDPAPLDVTGQIDVRCQGTQGSFFATVSTGGSGTFAQRQMVSGPYRLAYNFYLDASHTAIWGDGTGGSSSSGGIKVSPGRENYSLPVYGRVFPGQSVGAGTYSDDVLVTIVF
jgi:spore coat protein U-like protein